MPLMLLDSLDEYRQSLPIRRRAAAINIVLLALFIAVPVPGIAADNTNAVSAGVTGLAVFGATNTISYLAYETKPFDNPLVLSVKAGRMHSIVREGAYEERASGAGGEVGIRVYASGTPYIHGYYLGAGVGWWALSGEWKDDLGTPFVTTGPGRVSVIDLNGLIGKKIFLGSTGVYIDPSVQIGLLGARHYRPEEFGAGGIYLAAGISAGFAW